MSNTLTFDGVVHWLGACADAFTAEKERLTALDSAIGDGDHGANMARGFQAVQGKLAAAPAGDIGGLFKIVAMTLISTTGGASGPLYGTFFLQAAGVAKGKAELTVAELHTAFETGLAGVVKLGKAAVGEKTMVDALTPAIAALVPSGADDTLPAALARAVEAARVGAESTVAMVAHKGRASYLGERSAGHLDPGAASSLLLLQTLAKAVAG